ncbi:unnamed protein product, partial [Heterotrigona itama]
MHRADVALMSSMNSEARMRANILGGPRLLPAAGFDVDADSCGCVATPVFQRRGNHGIATNGFPVRELMPLSLASLSPEGWRSSLLQRPPAQVDGTFRTFRGIFDLYWR